MVGGTLALLNHSLQIDARLLRHHLYRLAFVGLLYVWVTMATFQSLLMGAPGKWLFTWIAYLNFAFISLAGISFFATAVSEEKEEDTLGLLRMAGIGPASLLLGKSTSRLIIAGLLLALQFPFTMLSITLGGVTMLQVVSVFWALLAYTALVANLALICSVFAKRASRASALMVALLALFFFAPPLINLIGTQLFGAAPTGTAGSAFQTAITSARDASVWNRLSVIMETGFSESPFSFQVGSNFAAAVLLFFVAQFVFDRVTRYHSAPSISRGMLIQSKQRWKALGTGRAWSRALMWKDFHFVTGGKPMILVKITLYSLIAAVAVLISVAASNSNPLAPISISIVSTMMPALLIESSLYASRVFRDEVQGNSLTSLMLLPVKTSAIAYSKVAGCLLGLIPAVVFLGAGFLCGMVAILVNPDAEAIFFSMFFVVLGGGTGLAWALFFVHLVAYLSLVVKWGSIPLSIAISLLCLVVGGCIFQFMAVTAFAGGAALLHVLIGYRLKQLATQ